MQTIRTTRLLTAYEARGDGREAVVLLHGNFAGPRWWRPLLDVLPERFCAFAPALRGCAGTEAPDLDFDVRTLALDLEAFAEALSLRRFHLVGHSLGAAVALQYALDLPARVASLVLATPAPVDGLSAMAPEGSSLAAWSKILRPGDPSSMWALSSGLRAGRLLGTDRLALRRALEKMTAEVPRDWLDLRALVDDAARLPPEAVVGFYEALARWDVRPRLPQLAAPTLVLCGARDPLVPEEAVRATARAIPGAQLVVREAGGHAPQLEDPEGTAALLVRFVDAQTPLARAQAWLSRALR